MGHLDLAATFCRVAGVEAPDWNQGCALPETTGSDRRQVLTEWDCEHRGTSTRMRSMHAVHSGRSGRRVLVVGEALGYRGGLLTGIPISCERLLREQRHPFWRRLAPQLTIEGDTPEATATIVWDYLANRRRIDRWLFRAAA